MPAKKKAAKPKKQPVRNIKKNGFLSCSACKRSIPYQGIEGSDPAIGDGPRHRCADGAIKPFTTFTLDDPNLPPLPKIAPGESIYPEGWL
jgi:hypothetical protein